MRVNRHVFDSINQCVYDCTHVAYDFEGCLTVHLHHEIK